MHSSGVMWLAADNTVPVNTRDVLITTAAHWEVRVAHYRGMQWISNSEPIDVAYWADFPAAPPPPNYQD